MILLAFFFFSLFKLYDGYNSVGCPRSWHTGTGLADKTITCAYGKYLRGPYWGKNALFSPQVLFEAKSTDVKSYKSDRNWRSYFLVDFFRPVNIQKIYYEGCRNCALNSRYIKIMGAGKFTEKEEFMIYKDVKTINLANGLPQYIDATNTDYFRYYRFQFQQLGTDKEVVINQFWLDIKVAKTKSPTLKPTLNRHTIQFSPVPIAVKPPSKKPTKGLSPAEADNGASTAVELGVGLGITAFVLFCLCFVALIYCSWYINKSQKEQRKLIQQQQQARQEKIEAGNSNFNDYQNEQEYKQEYYQDNDQTLQ